MFYFCDWFCEKDSYGRPLEWAAGWYESEARLIFVRQAVEHGSLVIQGRWNNARSSENSLPHSSNLQCFAQELFHGMALYWWRFVPQSWHIFVVQSQIRWTQLCALQLFQRRAVSTLNCMIMVWCRSRKECSPSSQKSPCYRVFNTLSLYCFYFPAKSNWDEVEVAKQLTIFWIFWKYVRVVYHSVLQSIW